MKRLRDSIAKKTNNFEKIDKEYAYAIWLIEKEFHVGMIDDEFPAMKLWNILDKENGERYKRESQTQGKGKGGTFR